MSKTRGDLVPAQIYESTKSGAVAGPVVHCMFNPFEYSVSKTNTYSEEAKNQTNVPQMTFSKAGSQTLKLTLTFDTYESGADVSLTTNKLWYFMQPKQPKTGGDRKEPPTVTFQWGVFCFVAVITSMTQKFTLFKKDGTPVRAKVDVTFTQHEDVNDYPAQNPTSRGDEALRTWRVIRGDRLDTIAANVYGDATKWRVIAEFNNLDSPFALLAGQELIIPEKVA
jgi:hypothetical protein